MDGVLHRLLFDTWAKLTQILFRTCPHCKEQVQRYLMNGTPVGQCSMCLTADPEMSLEEDSLEEGDRT